MKTNVLYLFLGMSASMALSACTDNDMAVSGGDATTLTGEKAYMVVNISNVGTMTRATTDGGWEYGTEEEYAVKDNNAHFYFYDESGVFVTEANIWEDGTPSEHVDGTADGNVEYTGKTMVVLDNLTSQTYPKYMVTVLNKPADFTAPATLTAFVTAKADEERVGLMQDETNSKYFTMSTASYVSGESDERPGYFVTELTKDDFHLEPIDDLDSIDPVTVYVERLAAKVTLTIDEGLENVATIDSDTYYTITHEVVEDSDSSADVDNPKANDETLYVKIDGWKLNGTARYSNMVKNIQDYTWGLDDSVLGFSWNDAENHRSYWGKSFNYGLTSNYPDSSSGNADADEATGTTTGTNLNEYLQYTSLGENVTLNELDASEYCAENTNMAGTGGIINSKNSSAITGILVKATLCNSEGAAQSYVRYDGMLWTESEYINYALRYLNDESNANYKLYYKDGETYKQLSADFLEIGASDGDYDGKVRVVLSDAHANDTFYDTTDGTGKDLDADDVQEYLDIFNNNGLALVATGYKNGAMYYNIPIEHLNNEEDEDGNLLEANYGVVRNHHYVVTITKLEGLGTGIFNPDEVIIPGAHEEEETYYVGAQVNILSWKLVNQQVEL